MKKPSMLPVVGVSIAVNVRQSISTPQCTGVSRSASYVNQRMHLSERQADQTDINRPSKYDNMKTPCTHAMVSYAGPLQGRSCESGIRPPAQPPKRPAPFSRTHALRNRAFALLPMRMRPLPCGSLASAYVFLPFCCRARAKEENVHVQGQMSDSRQSFLLARFGIVSKFMADLTLGD